MRACACVPEPPKNIPLDSGAKKTHTDYSWYIPLTCLFMATMDIYTKILVPWAFNGGCHRNGTRKHNV